MSTPHNSANKGDIAKVVLMPGDPLRAKYIAEKYLENPVQFNMVRNMFGYTGTYKGKKVSVMGGGMGMPSMGIYSYELFSEYDVEVIIRIGSAGALKYEMNPKDIVIGIGACTDSNYASQYKLPGTFAPTADFELASTAYNVAKKKDVPTYVGNIVSSDVFYNANKEAAKKWESMGVLATEMEAAALYMNAAYLKKRALTIATISDHITKKCEDLSAEERQNGFNDMMEIALETALTV